MDMAFTQARIGDADKAGALLQLVDRMRASIAQRGLDTAEKLMDPVLCRPLVGHLAFTSLGHTIQFVLGVLLEIAIGQAAQIGKGTGRGEVCEYVEITRGAV